MLHSQVSLRKLDIATNSAVTGIIGVLNPTKSFRYKESPTGQPC